MNRKRSPWLANGLAILLGGGIATTAMSVPPPVVGTSTDSQHNFLVFSERPENPATARAYMNTIDPTHSKASMTAWLKNAGFIQNESEWISTGQQVFTKQSDPAGSRYGVGKINAYAHFIYLNAADLGFIRNQYIRCNPDCKTPGASIYTYLENYPAPTRITGESDAAFALRTQQAVNIALETRVGRIADVAFEWAPAADGSNPKTLFGQIYAQVVHKNSATGNPANTIEESYLWPNDQAFWDATFNTRSIFTTGPDFLLPRPDFTVLSGDVFAPELDQLGTKQSPGVCYVCHGGNVPKNIQTTVASTGLWPNHGRDQEFRFIPADTGNGVFGVDDTAGVLVAGAFGVNLTQAGQELEIKKYNQAVLQTQGTQLPKNATFNADGTINGAWRPFIEGGRPSHGQEVILGWYQEAGHPANTMTASVQNGNFVPVGWRGSAEAQNLYLKVLAPSCRSCHMSREPSLDFGTQAIFDENKENVEQMVFLAECNSNNGQVEPGKQIMPAARLTWDRFWQGINAFKLIKGPNEESASDPTTQPGLLKAHFGYTPSGPGSFCAHSH